MARKVVLVSDITGKEADEKEFISLVIRQHPAITSPRQLDVLADEVSKVETASDIVILEINNGTKTEAVMSLADFRKIVPDEVVTKASGTRGRKLGTSPGNK
jgi:hypothetical protein